MPVDIKEIRLDQAEFQQTLEKKLADLPPLPAVVTRIMRTINDPDASAEELSRLIALDQGLSSKILRIVNSAYYGFPKRISTITHAVVILGFNTVRNLVLGVSAFGMLSQKSGGAGLDRTRFWEHSIGVAVASSLLAKEQQPRSRSMIEEAFIAGLLHDIGKLFLDCYFPVQFAVTVAYGAREQITTTQAEQRLLGMDHAGVGQRIAEHWNFPPLLTAALGAHHAPQPGSSSYVPSSLIMAADWLNWQAGQSSSPQCAPPEILPDVQEGYGLSDGQAGYLQEEWQRQFDKARDMFQLL